MSGDVGQSLVVRAGMVVVLLLFTVAMLVAFAYRRRLRRDFTHGVQGTAQVLVVRPTSPMQRRSVGERPTERIVVATEFVPRGVPVDQKFPAGSFAPGQLVPVLQRPGNPLVLRVEAPGQVPNTHDVYGYLAAAALGLLGAVLVLTGRLP